MVLNRPVARINFGVVQDPPKKWTFWTQKWTFWTLGWCRTLPKSGPFGPKNGLFEPYPHPTPPLPTKTPFCAKMDFLADLRGASHPLHPLATGLTLNTTRDDIQVFPQCISSVSFFLCWGYLIQYMSLEWKIIPLMDKRIQIFKIMLPLGYSKGTHNFDWKLVSSIFLHL